MTGTGNTDITIDALGTINLNDIEPGGGPPELFPGDRLRGGNGLIRKAVRSKGLL